jgi:hypothetical protein
MLPKRPARRVAAYARGVEITLLGLLGAGMGWLARDAHEQRAAGLTFGQGYRALLWAAAAVCGLVALVAGALTVLVAMESGANSGFAGILLLFTPLVTLTALIGALTFAWYARYRPAPQPPLSA